MTNASRSFLILVTLCVLAPAAAQAQFIESRTGTTPCVSISLPHRMRSDRGMP